MARRSRLIEGSAKNHCGGDGNCERSPGDHAHRCLLLTFSANGGEQERGQHASSDKGQRAHSPLADEEPTQGGMCQTPSTHWCDECHEPRAQHGDEPPKCSWVVATSERPCRCGESQNQASGHQPFPSIGALCDQEFTDSVRSERAKVIASGDCQSSQARWLKSTHERQHDAEGTSPCGPRPSHIAKRKSTDAKRKQIHLKTALHCRTSGWRGASRPMWEAIRDRPVEPIRWDRRGTRSWDAGSPARARWIHLRSASYRSR